MRKHDAAQPGFLDYGSDEHVIKYMYLNGTHVVQSGLKLTKKVSKGDFALIVWPLPPVCCFYMSGPLSLALYHVRIEPWAFVHVVCQLCYSPIPINTV